MSSGPNVYFIVPLTEEAEDWICENIANLKYQREGLVIGNQYIAEILEGMAKAGLVEGEDFLLHF